MKYISTLFLAILFCIQAFSQLAPLPQDRNEISPFKTPRSTRNLPVVSARNTVVLFEDFQSVNAPNLPSGWDGGNPVEQQQDNNNGIGLGTYVDAWQTGDAYSINNGGYIPVPHIDNNLFVFVNDDGDPCNCDMEDVGLTTPQLSFEGLENMIISFDVFSQATFGGDNISLEISTNGTDFITLYTAVSSPEWQPVQVDLSLFDDEPTVWLRFAWSDNGFWSTGGAIDNVLIAENLEYNAGILRAHTAEYTADWDDTETISGEYSFLPIEQATAFKPGATIMNKGALPLENVVLSVEVTFNDQSLGSFNSQVVDILYPMEEKDVYVATSLTPDQTGTYIIEYTLLYDGDEDPTDNTAERPMTISEDVYALDDDAADSFRDNNQESFTIGNLFEVPNDGSICHSIGVGIGAGSVNGTEIQVRLYTSNNIYITGSQPYIIQNDDKNQLGQNNIVNIPLTEPYELQAGQDYLAVVTYFANPFWQFTIANSGSSQEQFSVLQDEIGDWFYTTTTPMVRMNLSSTVDVADLDIADNNLIIAPNPVSDSFTLNWPRAESGKARILISDSRGRTVLDKEARINNGMLQTDQLSLKNLTPGIYQLTTIQNDQLSSVRFMKGQ